MEFKTLTNYQFNALSDVDKTDYIIAFKQHAHREISRKLAELFSKQPAHLRTHTLSAVLLESIGNHLAEYGTERVYTIYAIYRGNNYYGCRMTKDAAEQDKEYFTLGSGFENAGRIKMRYVFEDEILSHLVTGDQERWLQGERPDTDWLIDDTMPQG